MIFIGDALSNGQGELSTFVNQQLSEYQIAIFNLMLEQVGDQNHPLQVISNELTKAFALQYAEYTGVSAEYKIQMSAEQKQAMFSKMLQDSFMLQQQANNTMAATATAATTPSQTTTTVQDASQYRVSIFTRAADELYNICTCFCLMVEKFFQPLLPNIDKDEEFQPNKVLKDLHEDIWKVCQRLIFN